MTRVFALVAVALVVVTMPGSAQQGGRGAFVAGDVLVRFRPGVASATVAAAHRDAGAAAAGVVQRTGVQRVRVPAGTEAAAIAQYRRNPNVLYAEPNFIRTVIPAASSDAPQVLPDDYHFAEQWGLHNTGQPFYCIPWGGTPLCFYSGTADADIDAPEAWAISQGSAAVSVAVIDTGVDYTHPDLAANYAGGDDFVNGDGDPMDDHGHGTHVAGIIAAAAGNLTGVPGTPEGVVGVAPQSRILAYKVCAADGTCDDFAVEQAIARAVADGARVINMSLGSTDYSQSLNDAVQDGWNAGLVIVAGAGNNGVTDPFYPAAFDNVVSVAAFDEDGRRASFSNYGSWVDLAAPGNVIFSTYPMAMCSPSTQPGNTGCYTWLSGTSMATPFVAGAAALVWARDDVVSNQQVVDDLLLGADPAGVGGPRLDSWTVHGGLNLFGAVTYGLTSPPPPATQVAVTAAVPQAAEAGPVSGRFDITRTGSTSAPLTVFFAVSGTALAGVDYQAIPSPITIAAGSTTASIAVTPLDDGLFESNETVVLTLVPDAAYALGSPGGAVVTIVSDDLPPDLVVSSVTAPSLGGADTDIVVTDTTANQGTGASLASRTGFYLSANASLDASDALLGSRQVPALAPGASQGQSTTVHIPPSTAPGLYYVLAKADYDSVVPEGVETNNQKLSAIVKVGPDLVVSTLTTPASAAAGASLVVSDTTTNQGGGAADASITRYYLSANTVVDSADTLLGSRFVPLLAAGASSAWSVAVILPAGTAAGSYYLLAQADGASTVRETSETNNTRVSAAIKVGPDLVVTVLTAPASATPGSTIGITDTTKNQGAGPSPSSSTGFYLSADLSIGTTDLFLGSRDIGELAAGDSASGTVWLPIPADVEPGSYRVLARADWNNGVAESAETNNDKASGAVKIGGDLVLTSLSVSPTAAAGGPITVSDTTANQGTAVVGQSATGFYLSLDYAYDPATDTLLGTRPVASLQPSAASTASTPFVVPAGLAAGTYNVIAVADWGAVVPESVETNNTRSGVSVRIGPDLVMASVSGPSSAVAGTSIAAGDTTTNQGGEAAPASATSYYLSVNTVLDAGDLLLGSRAVASIGAGASNAGAVTLVIPASMTPGTYYIIAKADGGSAIAEASETNNTRARAISIASAP